MTNEDLVGETVWTTLGLYTVVRPMGEDHVLMERVADLYATHRCRMLAADVRQQIEGPADEQH